MEKHSLALLIVLACGCPREEPGVGSEAEKESTDDASGTLEIQRDKGALQLDLDDCWSGQQLSFYGVDLFDDPDLAKRLRIVDDAVHGKQIVLLGIVPDRARVVVNPDNCPTFDVRIEPTNNYLNDVRVLKGSLKLDCNLPDESGKLSATVQLNDCSFDNRAANP